MKDKRIWVGTNDQLISGVYKKMDVMFRGEAASIIVFRHDDQCLAYLNLCVHMPRELDCQRSTIFDLSGKFLRCSFHGIVYHPLTGESISTLCNGEKLTAIRLLQYETGVWLNDKRVKPGVNLAVID